MNDAAALTDPAVYAVALWYFFRNSRATARTEFHDFFCNPVEGRKFDGAGSENRTRTLLPEPDFELECQRLERY